MSESKLLDDATDQIMVARRTANEVMLGKRGLSAGERIALAEGFQACDRQRAEFARELQDARSHLAALRLTGEERIKVIALREDLVHEADRLCDFGLHTTVLALLDRLLDELKLLGAQPANDENISTADAATIARVTAGTVRRWVRKKVLKKHGAGARVRIRRDELEQYLRGADEAAPTPEDRARKRFA